MNKSPALLLVGIAAILLTVIGVSGRFVYKMATKPKPAFYLVTYYRVDTSFMGTAQITRENGVESFGQIDEMQKNIERANSIPSGRVVIMNIARLPL